MSDEHFDHSSEENGADPILSDAIWQILKTGTECMAYFDKEASALRLIGYLGIGYRHYARDNVAALQWLFTEPEIAKDVGIELAVQQLQPYKVHTPKELMRTLRSAHDALSWSNEGGRKISVAQLFPYPVFNASKGRFSSFADYPARYNMELTYVMLHEAALMNIEPWVWQLRDIVGGKLVLEDGGQSEDTAAFLSQLGVRLSAESMARTWARLFWCIREYPEREDELRRFCQKFGFPKR